MEKYKKDLKRRSLLSVLLALAMFAYSIYMLCAAQTPKQPELSVIKDFQSGMCLGIGIMALAIFFRCRMRLRDDKKLQIGYYKEHDERMIVIRTKAGYPFSIVAALLMIFAGLALANVNLAAAITAIACGVGLILLSAVLKIVYCKLLS